MGGGLLLTFPLNALQPMKLFLGISRPMKNLLNITSYKIRTNSQPSRKTLRHAVDSKQLHPHYLNSNPVFNPLDHTSHRGGGCFDHASGSLSGLKKKN